MIYWYYVYVYRAKAHGAESPLFQADVFRGEFSELVLHVHKQSRADEYYTDFHLVNWNKITKEAFDSLDGILG